MTRWFAIPLWKRVIGGLMLGVLLGALWPEAAPSVKIVGDLFVRLIKMLVVPVVLVTIAAGIAALVCALVLGPRRGFPETPMMPHNMTMVVTGGPAIKSAWSALIP